VTKSEPTGIHSALRYKLMALVGQENVRPATAADVISGVQAKLVVAPGTEKEVAEVLRHANDAGLAVVPRGGGTKPGWGNPPPHADLILSMTRVNEIIEHAWADLTVTVEAGCTIQRLQETLTKHGQRLALDPLWPEKATVGGVVSTNESGALRLRFGALRDLILGVTIALPDGTLATSGGKVVKNVAGYDLPKLATGALGTLGVITRAVFRLHPLPRNSRSYSIPMADAKETQRFVRAVQDSKLAHTALQSEFSGETKPVSHILLEGTEEGLAWQEPQVQMLSQGADVSEAAASVWNARQELWTLSNPEGTAIGKFAFLPAELAATIAHLEHAAGARLLRWKALTYGMGIGWLRLEGEAEALHEALGNLRGELEAHGGSLTILHRPEKMAALDAWGTAGDALPLMKSVKRQLDAKSTLNPGRFVGGI